MKLSPVGDRSDVWRLMFALLATTLCCSLAAAAPITKPPQSAEPAAAEEAETSKPKVDAATPAPSVADTGAMPELNAAIAAFAAGKIAQCEDQLRAAYAKRPNLPPPKMMLARLVLAAGNFAVGRQLLEEVAVSHPQHPELYLLFGQLALGDGHLADAAVHFEKAQAMPAPSVWNDAQRTFLKNECVAGQTLVAERRGDWDQAAKLYQQRLGDNAQQADLRDRYATALFRAGEKEQAFEQFDVAHRQDGKLNPPEVSMAVMCVADGEYRQADRWFQKALAAHADDPAVHMERSIALMFEDRAAEAEKSAAQAAKLGLNSPELSGLRGAIALQQADYARAEEHFRAQRKALPSGVVARSQLALALVEQKPSAKRDEALRLARELVGEHPQHPQALAALGWVLFRHDQVAEAEKLLSQAAMQRAEPATLFFLARTLRQAGKQRECEAIARELQSQLDQPSVVPLRPGMRKWLATVLPDAPVAVDP